MINELKKSLSETQSADDKKASVEKVNDELEKLSNEDLDEIAGGRPNACPPGSVPNGENGCRKL